jgi:serine/threonine protein phosphatase PrpC
MTASTAIFVDIRDEDVRAVARVFGKQSRARGRDETQAFFATMGAMFFVIADGLIETIGEDECRKLMASNIEQAILEAKAHRVREKAGLQ